MAYERPLSFEEYRDLLHQGQQWVASAQAKDPQWKAYLDKVYSTSAENQGQLGASPTKDYWADWRKTLTPEVAADFDRHMADSGSWTDKVGSVLKFAVPALVGGAGLAATGLLGPGLQAAVGGAPMSAPVAGSGSILGGGVGGTGSGLGVPGLNAGSGLGLGGAAGAGGSGIGIGGGSSVAGLIGKLPGIGKIGGMVESLLGGGTQGDARSAGMPMGRNGVAMDPSMFKVTRYQGYKPASGLQALYETTRRGLI